MEATLWRERAEQATAELQRHTAAATASASVGPVNDAGAEQAARRDADGAHAAAAAAAQDAAQSRRQAWMRIVCRGVAREQLRRPYQKHPTVQHRGPLTAPNDRVFCPPCQVAALEAEVAELRAAARRAAPLRLPAPADMLSSLGLDKWQDVRLARKKVCEYLCGVSLKVCRCVSLFACHAGACWVLWCCSTAMDQCRGPAFWIAASRQQDRARQESLQHIYLKAGLMREKHLMPKQEKGDADLESALPRSAGSSGGLMAAANAKRRDVVYQVRIAQQSHDCNSLMYGCRVLPSLCMLSCAMSIGLP